MYRGAHDFTFHPGYQLPLGAQDLRHRAAVRAPPRRCARCRDRAGGRPAVIQPAWRAAYRDLRGCRDSPGAAGITLAPWANRVEDGVWYLDGRKQQLDITEVSKNNASHGLLRNTSYGLVDESEFSVTLEATVFPQHGYPFLVRHRVQYLLAEDLGLEVRQTLINDSTAPAPFVLGAHPYLRLGDADLDELRLTVSAGTRLVADGRLIPRSAEPVSGDTDLREGRPVGTLDIDVALTDITFDGGVARHTLAAPDGRSVSLWQDEKCSYVHVFVTTQFPGRARAVAIEPMTGPANAFNSGDGLRWLQPGDSFTMGWGIDAALGAAG